MTLKNLLRIALYPLTRTFYGICSLIPRSSKTWIFGSYSNGFADNAKYLFTYVTDTRPDIRAIWISGNPTTIEAVRRGGGKSYHRWSLAGVYYSVIGKIWYINSYVSDINYFTSNGASVFNLWHGIPLKKIEYDIERGPLRELFHTKSQIVRKVLTPATFRTPDYVLSTSTYISQSRFAPAFRVSADRCPVLGYPRIAPFFWSEDFFTAWIKRWGTQRQLESIKAGKCYRRRVVYMPTWRDNNVDFLGPDHLDPARLNESLLQSDSILYLKLHFSTPKAVLEKFRGYSNLYILESDEDIYPLLKHVDLLITDYSSVYFDYLLLDKEVCFYAFDLDEYANDVRGFYADYREQARGFIATSQAELLAYLADQDHISFAESRGELTKQLHDYVDGNAAERIISYMLNNEGTK